MATLIVGPGEAFTSIQAAINAASNGDTILIKPGVYVEDGHGADVNRSGLTIDKSVTLLGVDANGDPIINAAQVQATVISGFMSGDNTSIRITAPGVNIQGLGFDALPSTPGGFTGGFVKALVSVMADDVSITDSSFVAGKSSYSIELNGTGLFGPAADSYAIIGNLIGGPIWLLEGVGDGLGGDEIISSNTFFGTAPDGTQSGVFVMGGNVAGYAPTTPSLPTDMSGNVFADGLPVPLFLRSNAATDPNGLADVATFEAFAAENLSGADDTYAYAIDDATGRPVLARVGSQTNFDQYLASSLNVLNTYQTTGVKIGTGNPIIRDAITESDTIVVKTVGETAVTIHDENLTIRAVEGSDGLTLTLADTPFINAATRTTAVNDITLADYAPGQGADVDVVGNSLKNRITGNSGDNILSGGGGEDVLIGGAGDDTLNGGDGLDVALFDGARADHQVVRNRDGSFTVISADGVDTVTGVETLQFDDVAVRVVNPGQSIQAAIDAASDGDVILIEAGVYVEQLTIDGFSNLTLRAASGEVIVRSPVVLNVNGTSATYGDPVRAVIAVTDSRNVRLEGLTVDGAYSGDTTLGSNGDEIAGVAFLQSSGSIDKLIIEKVSNSPAGGLFGLQHGSGLFVDGGDVAGLGFSATATTVRDFQKTGALITGVNLTFTGNTVTGIGATNLIAQNAMQVFDAAGVISGNVLSGFGYSGPLYYSSGLIVYEPSGPLTITGNTITGTGAGSAGLDLSDTDGQIVTVTGNAFSNLLYGIYAYTFDSTIGLDPGPNAFGNSFTGIIEEGVHLDAEESYSGPFSTNIAFSQDGTLSDDYLAGSNGNDRFTGFSGADQLLGRGGDDLLDGGAGADTMTGGSGDDTYVVDDAGDQVNEGAGGGSDTVRTGLSAYTLAAQVETLVGTSGAGQSLTGNGLGNTILGGAGDDVLDGGLGGDLLNGGGGNDTYVVDDTADQIVDSAGLDTVRTTLAAYTLGGGLENLTGLGSSGQALTGNGGANTVTGGTGADTLSGLGGADVLNAGDGADTLIGGGGDDSLDGGAGSDTASFAGARDDFRVVRNSDGSFTITDLRDGAAEGSDTVRNVELFQFTDGTRNTGNLINPAASVNGSNKDDVFNDVGGRDTTYRAGNGSDTVRGGDGADTLYGENGDDALFGGSGADFLSGGNGRDVLEGGAGNDVLEGGNGPDTFVFRAGFGDDRIVDFDVKTDRLDFQGLGAASILDDGADTVISFADGSSVRLVGVDTDAFAI